MRILIIKTSSMGDIIHTLPAVTDAITHLQEIEIDWVIEEAYSQIPDWHSGIKNVIPIAQRRWRTRPFSSAFRQEKRNAVRQICKQYYDYVMDVQGLLKSALLARHARGQRVGMNWHSAREGLASLFYHQRLDIPRGQHAINRIRQFFAETLKYQHPQGICDYGIAPRQFQSTHQHSHSLLFIHSTARAYKEWPETSWQELALMAVREGYKIELPWGNSQELQRARRIAAVSDAITVLPRLDLNAISGVLSDSRAVVAVDTGLAHMAAAFQVPTLSLYGNTDAQLIGTVGKGKLLHLQGTGGKMSSILPTTVWKELQRLL